MRRPPPLSNFIHYPVTAGTALLAIGVTLASWGNVDISQLEASPLIGRGELWRLVTATLPHVSVWHLAFNVYWTWTFGTLIEEVFGHAATLGIFVLLGAGSMAAEWALIDGGIGLSGIGYGLFGLLWILEQHDCRFADAIDKSTIQMFVAWFFLCIVLTWAKIYPVANIAHGVGALLGAQLGACIAFIGQRRIGAIAALALTVALCLAGATVARPYVNLSTHAAEVVERFGYEALDRNDDADALRWLSQAVQMEPRQSRAWHNLGVALERLNRIPEADRAFRRESELDPHHLDGR